MCCCWYNIGSNALGDYLVHCCVNNYINKLLSMLTNWLNFTIWYNNVWWWWWWWWILVLYFSESLCRNLYLKTFFQHMMIPAMTLVLWCTRQLAFSLPAVALAIWIWNLYVFQSKCLDIWIWKCFEIKIDN